MKMRLFSFCCVAVLATVLFFSCSKTETINELTLPSSERVAATTAANCDYSEAYGTGFGNNYDDSARLTNIFAKTYEPGTNRITHMKTAVIDKYAGPYNPDDITITYKGNNMICFSKKYNDTIANFTLDPITKKPVSAIARAEFEFAESKVPFQFVYSSGHLIQIRGKEWFPDPTPRSLKPFITIQYQDSYRNIHQVFYGALNSPAKTVYTYDKKTTFTEQYYPDQVEYAFYDFWAFVKQLNLFPELQPQFRLVQAYHYDPEYPYDDISTFSNQQADASGKLISYDITKGFKNSDYRRVTHYTINWQCNVAQNAKQPN